MCDPVIGAVIGGGQAALGVMGQNKALAARNKNRALLYGRDLNTIHGKHLENVSNYYLRGVDAEISWDDNLIAASQQVDRQQTAVNAKIADSLRNTEDAYVKMISDPRIAKSLERSGRSARRVSQSFKAALGRVKSRSAAEVDAQVDQSLGLLEEISEWRRRQDREATMKIGLEPQRAADPPKPVFEKGPSLFSSLMKIAVGAAQGYLMGNELKQAGLFQGGGGKLATPPTKGIGPVADPNVYGQHLQSVQGTTGIGPWASGDTYGAALSNRDALFKSIFDQPNVQAVMDSWKKPDVNPLEDLSAFPGVE